ncbi:hypothetical protein HW561_14720 [Rhodobacteraceae bacterium B1Z28]|uniref:Secreted protein with PEP-CTERM sorting signal n=1 Tax=Ruegeria haliotis TaxID=2747601 RepID=A0ABX2PTQ4_9RHOB|nr:hypothetical protein [Ruegeria haliotis]NVO57046.1 hypothetical protein [Ruegeria haliotis]
MLEGLSSEVILSLAGAGVSVLALGGITMALRPKPRKSDIDVDALVRNAPYHRLHNVVALK